MLFGFFWPFQIPSAFASSWLQLCLFHFRAYARAVEYVVSLLVVVVVIHPIVDVDLIIHAPVLTQTAALALAALFFFEAFKILSFIYPICRLLD